MQLPLPHQAVVQGVPLPVTNSNPKEFGRQLRTKRVRCSASSGEMGNLRFPLRDLTVCIWPRQTIILQGRRLNPDGSLVKVEVEEVAKIHDLEMLWKWVLEDAKPKIPQDTWENFDVGFAEKCIMEFDAIDKKGSHFGITDMAARGVISISL